VAAAAPEELEPTEARGLQAPVSSNSFCTARLRATVPVGGGGGGWFSLAKGVATRWRPRGDGVGERDRVEEAVERRGVAGTGVERYRELTSRARRRGRRSVVGGTGGGGGGGGIRSGRGDGGAAAAAMDRGIGAERRRGCIAVDVEEVGFSGAQRLVPKIGSLMRTTRRTVTVRTESG